MPATDVPTMLWNSWDVRVAVLVRCLARWMLENKEKMERNRSSSQEGSFISTKKDEEIVLCICHLPGGIKLCVFLDKCALSQLHCRTIH